MFKIIGTTIHITRGDKGIINFSITNGDENKYNFKVGDVVRLRIFKKKKCDNVVLTKDVKVENTCDNVDIPLIRDDTLFCKIINKPMTYWYEIELNPGVNQQTVIGYDLEGAKEFIIYPEGKENE